MKSLHVPNPVLNEEEQELLDSAPEECFRRAVQRGALSLDEVTANLSPHISAVVCSIVTGERLTASDLKRTRSPDQYQIRASLHQPRKLPETSLDQWSREKVRIMLVDHPQLVQILDEQILSPDETMEAAHTLDHILGRYATGTRYAAP